MSPVRVEVAGGVATLTLDEPGRRNALTTEMVAEIVGAFDGFEGNDEVRAVVVTGAPPAFCAGADLSHLGDAAEPGLRQIYEGFLRVARSPLPTVAAVNGPAVGAGMNLALACDVRMAGESARFDARFLQLGLHPGGGHTWMLQRAVGPEAARAMVLFGQVLGGAEAVRRGLAWACVPDSELLDAARELAAQAAAVAPELARRAKATMREIVAVDEHDRAVDLELEAQVWSLEQPAFAEMLAAMRARLGRGAGGTQERGEGRDGGT